MALIKVGLGGKGKGLADQASIEPIKGCTNKCAGCYAAKTTRMGKKFFEANILKEFDKDEFRKSCKAVKKKGIKLVRMSKHCDPGHQVARTIVKEILKIMTEEDLRAVVVTKSLEYDAELSQILKEGKHIVHFSLGMKSENAPPEIERFKTWKAYKDSGVKAKLRIVADVTIPTVRWKGFNSDYIIVTPMRYTSKESLSNYRTNIDNYKFQGGYYRPQIVDPSWQPFQNWCGEIGNTTYCCNCLGGEECDNLPVSQS